MTTQLIPNDVIIQGNLLVDGDMPAYDRTELTLESNARHVIQWDAWRVHDAFGTLIPATGGNDDLGLYGGTFGTDAPSLQTGDLKNNTSLTTRYARCTFTLPHEYVGGQNITIRLNAGMVTTVASAAGTVDVEAYLSDDAAGEVGVGSDLCATAAQSCNSLTFAPKDFTITPTGLLPGDTLDLRVAIGVNDTATATAVIGCIGAAEVLLGVKG